MHTIIGNGSIGQALALLLSQSTPVTLIDRSRFEGSRKLRSNGSLSLTKQIPFQANIPESSFIWICCKNYDLENLIEQHIHTLRETEAVLIACQNGFQIVDSIEKLLGVQKQIIRCLPVFGALKRSEQDVTFSGTPRVLIGGELSEEILTTLKRSSIEYSAEESASDVEWRKGLTNIVINSLCTLINQNNGALLKSPELREAAHDLCAEYNIVMRQYAPTLTLHSAEELLASIENHSENINSLLQDLRNGRQTERLAIFGSFLKLAQAQSIKTPKIEILGQMLAALESVDSAESLPNSPI